MNAVLPFVAAGLLPFAAAFTWRTSRVVSVALAIATIAVAYWIASLLFGVMPWDGLRWAVACVTSLFGLVAIDCHGDMVRHCRSLPSLADELRRHQAGRLQGALLVGSSIADFVSLHREAQGAEFGALPVLQIVVLLAMIWISLRRGP